VDEFAILAAKAAAARIKLADAATPATPSGPAPGPRPWGTAGGRWPTAS
jgi:hypothetical protein